MVQTTTCQFRTAGLQALVNVLRYMTGASIASAGTSKKKLGKARGHKTNRPYPCPIWGLCQMCVSGEVARGPWVSVLAIWHMSKTTIYHALATKPPPACCYPWHGPKDIGRNPWHVTQDTVQ